MTSPHGLKVTFGQPSFLNVTFSPNEAAAANVTLVRLECPDVTFARNGRSRR
jgi:hypothetical protein